MVFADVVVAAVMLGISGFLALDSGQLPARLTGARGRS